MFPDKSRDYGVNLHRGLEATASHHSSELPDAVTNIIPGVQPLNHSLMSTLYTLYINIYIHNPYILQINMIYKYIIPNLYNGLTL